jgi:hypothetical protein
MCKPRTKPGIAESLLARHQGTIGATICTFVAWNPLRMRLFGLVTKTPIMNGGGLCAAGPRSYGNTRLALETAKSWGNRSADNPECRYNIGTPNQ